MKLYLMSNFSLKVYTIEKKVGISFEYFIIKNEEISMTTVYVSR